MGRRWHRFSSRRAGWVMRTRWGRLNRITSYSRMTGIRIGSRRMTKILVDFIFILYQQWTILAGPCFSSAPACTQVWPQKITPSTWPMTSTPLTFPPTSPSLMARGAMSVRVQMSMPASSTARATTIMCPAYLTKMPNSTTLKPGYASPRFTAPKSKGSSPMRLKRNA